MTVLFNAHFDYQTSGTVSVTNEPGITGIYSGNPSFSSANKVHGAAGMLTLSAAPSGVKQDLLTPLGACYWRGYVQRTGTNSATAGFALAKDGATTTIASLAVSSAGVMSLRDGTTNVATSSFTWTVGAWVRYEWYVNKAANTQSVSLFYGANLEGTTPSETLSGACNSGTSPVYGIISGLNNSTAGSQFAFDELVVADAPIGPYVVPYTISVWDGSTEVAATVSVWDGSSEIAGTPLIKL
jgi:hypothetical protein